MVILYIHSTSWRMKSVFYERQQGVRPALRQAGKLTWAAGRW
jgi:hypothetical protein